MAAHKFIQITTVGTFPPLAIRHNMRFEAFVEVEGAHDGVDDCYHKQHDSEHGEGSERVSRGEIFFDAVGIGEVHAEEFETEVGEATEVDDLAMSSQRDVIGRCWYR